MSSGNPLERPPEIGIMENYHVIKAHFACAGRWVGKTGFAADPYSRGVQFIVMQTTQLVFTEVMFQPCKTSNTAGIIPPKQHRSVPTTLGYEAMNSYQQIVSARQVCCW